MLQVHDLSKSYGETRILDRIGFAVRQGEFFGILGPNGSGKSTLLKLISRAENPDSGRVLLDGRPMETFTRKQLSRTVAVLQQESLPPVDFTVKEVVGMGRFPYQNWLGEETGEREGIVETILGRLGLAELRDRSLQHLSGGERQRVALGKAMAQQPRLLLLDEPTTYLDIGHQIQMLDRIAAWQREADLTVVAVLHDLNLASIYCNRMLMLHRGEILRLGNAADVLQPDFIQEVYGTRPIVVPHPVHLLPQIMLQRGGSQIE
ncbi:ATP-binding cassette domain-containing protein [Cohnella sp. CFH 77786]|uniref:ABC transporter ATP-binding protein n=1 Tax=Cohnella sp. CFH 77786 TaxID=2662265 RepID=UPI001C60E17C|nr:ABC transporter ATP-binding protein [Cohnella sp. CFH 77786]MBW5448019.1 ATP-binding cassette domain-containing protein [Cohnella sp. CFH 77786]